MDKGLQVELFKDRDKFLKKCADMSKDGAGVDKSDRCPIIMKHDAHDMPRHRGCALAPDDVPEECLTDKGKMLNLLMGGRYSIDGFSFNCGCPGWDSEMVYYIRMRNEGAPVLDTEHIGGSCIMYAEHECRCKLGSDSMPFEGRTVACACCDVHLSDDERALLWLPYQEILKPLAETFRSNYKLGLPDDEASVIIPTTSSVPGHISNMSIYAWDSPEGDPTELLILRSDNGPTQSVAYLHTDCSLNAAWWRQLNVPVISLCKHKLVASMDIDVEVAPSIIGTSPTYEKLYDEIRKHTTTIGDLIVRGLFHNDVLVPSFNRSLTTIDRLICESYPIGDQFVNYMHDAIEDDVKRYVSHIYGELFHVPIRERPLDTCGQSVLNMESRGVSDKLIRKYVTYLDLVAMYQPGGSKPDSAMLEFVLDECERRFRRINLANHI